MQMNASIAMVAISLAAFGCIQIVQAPPPAPAAQSTPAVQPSGEARTTAAFGIFANDASGEPRFVETDSVPNVEGQVYAWFLRVGDSDQPVGWTEAITLPSRPASWEDATSAPNVSISPDGRTAITQARTVPESGFIYHEWAIAAGDPDGEYTIEVVTSTGQRQEFRFSVRTPAPSETSGPTTLVEAVRVCKQIQAAAEIPIGCEVEYIQGVPSMVVGFQSIDDVADYWEPMADNVAKPFCSAANSANRKALVFVLVGDDMARPFMCELDTWGDWFDLETPQESF